MRGENRKKVIEFIKASHPRAVTSADISNRTGVSQAQVYQIARGLLESGLIRAARDGRSWRYTWNIDGNARTHAMPRPMAGKAADFAARARDIFSQLFDEPLEERAPGGGQHSFALVSADGGFTGDVLYFPPSAGGTPPPARLEMICGRLWLLEKCAPDVAFLVLGGDETTAAIWRQAYAALCDDVDVYYLDDGDDGGNMALLTEER